ncbi:LLM class flavin-dependent oxidoreductase [Streptomyces bacillaris]|uniref:LLM class flavin-dependent oxidoreductase n=1 Tax=Streptomyces bacillaris TaxID=68179 RepID=UPI0036C5A2B2
MDATAALAREAAGAGLRSAWFGQRFGVDSPALTGIVGRKVPGPQVGTFAVPVFGRHPLLVSGQAQTVQAATHGRHHLGLALGARHIVEGGFGIAWEHIVPAVTRVAEEAGRLAPRIVALVNGVVTDDVDAVRQRVAEQLAFHEKIPSYVRAIQLSGGRQAIDVAVIGDEKAVAAEVRRYRDAGATEVVFAGTEAAGEAARRRTWALLGELAG